MIEITVEFHKIENGQRENQRNQSFISPTG